jgi:HPt (histidine-containing phosphotransfer) domain-containing protein
MPGLNGEQVLRQARAAGVLSFQAMALTGETDDDSRQRMRAAGFAEILAKPLDPGVLLDRVGALLGRSPAADSWTTAADPAQADEPLLDTAVLDRMGARLPPGLMEDLLSSFRKELEEAMSAMAAAIPAADTEAVARFAHTLKGSAGSFGARSLATGAKALEQVCRQGPPSAVAERFRTLRAQARQTDEALKAYNESQDRPRK